MALPLLCFAFVFATLPFLCFADSGKGDGESIGSYTCKCTNFSNVTNSCLEWDLFKRQRDNNDHCFIGHGLVVTSGGARIPLRQVRAGDSVLVSSPDGLTTYYDIVYDFLHINIKTEVELYEICLAGHEAPRAGPEHSNNRGPLVPPPCLDVTADHLVFDSDMTPHRARNIVVGQQLRHVAANGSVTVSVVKRVTRYVLNDADLYAPATYSGVIVVNDVVASVYSNIPNGRIAYSLAHASMAPLRFYHSTRAFLGYQPTSALSVGALGNQYHPWALFLQSLFRWTL